MEPRGGTVDPHPFDRKTERSRHTDRCTRVPMIPALNDHELENILSASADAGGPNGRAT